MFDLISSPADLHSDVCVRACSFADAVHAEIADAFPDVEPSAEELDAEFQRELARCERLADAAGITYGFRHRTRDGGAFQAFADLPDGERVFDDRHFPFMLDAQEAAILLAGRLAAEMTTPVLLVDVALRTDAVAVIGRREAA